MAFTIITRITAGGALQPLSDDPGKEAIDICRSAWNSAYDEQAERQINPSDSEKNSPRKIAKNDSIKKLGAFRQIFAI